MCVPQNPTNFAAHLVNDHVHTVVQDHTTQDQGTTARSNHGNNRIAIDFVRFFPAVNIKQPQTFNASMPVSLRCLCWSLMMMNGVPNSSKPNEPGMKDMVPLSTFPFVRPLYTRAKKIKLKHEMLFAVE